MTDIVAPTVLSDVHSYLASYGSTWTFDVTAARFFWSADRPLHEILVSSTDGREGYLLVSESNDLPFLISKGFNGKLLSALLQSRLNEMATRGLIAAGATIDSFQYVVPFSFIAHMSDGTAIQLDDGVIVEQLSGAVAQAAPEGAEIERAIELEWAELRKPSDPRLLIEETVLDSGPYYNQAYNASCVISGCTAVGWATWAAWLKGNAAFLPNLFPSSDCWYDSWGSFWKCDQPTEQCQEVDQLIWWFNRKLGTVNGGTAYNNIIRGTAVFQQFGSPKIAARNVSPDAGTIGGQIRRGSAVLFTGVREWQFVSPAPDKFGTLYDAPAGHCVVVHGIRGNEIYVNMGWGEWTESLWWNVNSISQRQTFGLFQA